MAKIITIAQQKGGAGKTTLAAHIAVSLLQMKYNVAIIDIDPQGSLTNWHALREKNLGIGHTGLNFISSAGWRVESAINNIQDNYDYVIIDAPPHTETESKSAIRASDLIIIPMQASPTDLWATRSTIEFAQSEDIPVKILLNRFNPQAKLAREVISQITVEIFKNYFGNRVAFSSCFLKGLSAIEISPKSQAAFEAKAVTKELLGMFNDKNNALGHDNKRAIAKNGKKRAIAKI